LVDPEAEVVLSVVPASLGPRGLKAPSPAQTRAELPAEPPVRVCPEALLFHPSLRVAWVQTAEPAVDQVTESSVLEAKWQQECGARAFSPVSEWKERDEREELAHGQAVGKPAEGESG
jgi:hypothetical protein